MTSGQPQTRRPFGALWIPLLVYLILETLAFTSAPLPKEEGRYAACAEIIPGQSRRFDLDVPAGMWSYELRPAGAGPVGLTGRIMIPKEDIAFGQ